MALLQVKNLSKRFGGLVAVNNVNFEVNDGEILALIGPNGAGKTTLYNLFSGFLPATSGQVFFQDKNISHMRAADIAKLGIIRTFQLQAMFPNLSVLDSVAIGFHLDPDIGHLDSILGIPLRGQKEKQTIERAKEIIQFIGLEEVEDRLCLTLSHGHQRLLGIAMALAAQPKLLILDEPATGMTKSEQISLSEKIRQIRERGITVFIIEHNMSFVMNTAERIVVLNFGEKIAEGLPSEIMTNPEVIRVYLGVKSGTT